LTTLYTRATMAGMHPLSQPAFARDLVRLSSGEVSSFKAIHTKKNQRLFSLPWSLMHWYVELRSLACGTAFLAGLRFILYYNHNISERILWHALKLPLHQTYHICPPNVTRSLEAAAYAIPRSSARRTVGHGKARRAQQNTAISLHLETSEELRWSHTRALQEDCLMTVSGSILTAWKAGRCPLYRYGCHEPLAVIQSGSPGRSSPWPCSERIHPPLGSYVNQRACGHGRAPAELRSRGHERPRNLCQRAWARWPR